MKRTGNKVFSAVVLTVANGLTMLACSRATTGHVVQSIPSSSAPTPLVAAAELPKYFPALPEIATIMGSPGLHQHDSTTAIQALPAGRSISDPKCVSLMSAGLDTTYSGSHQQGGYGVEASDDQFHSFEAYTVGFPTAADADTFVIHQLDTWKRCSDRTLTVSVDNRPPANFMVGPLRKAEGVSTIVRMQEGGHEFGCGRAVAAKGNVAADVLLCGFTQEAVEHQVSVATNLLLSKLPK